MDLRVKPTSSHSEAIRKLREAIMVGYFQPGERLVETTLCGQLGISRPSLREALRVLATEQLIVITPHRGPSVAVIGWEEAAQIYDTRILLEGELAVMAAKRAKVEDVERMREALARFEAAVKAGDPVVRLTATTHFYEAIIACSGLHIIGGLIHGLVARINFLRAKTMASPGRAKHSVREMTALFEAIASHDVRGARAAAVAHVNAARQEAQDIFELEAKPAATAAPPPLPRSIR